MLLYMGGAIHYQQWLVSPDREHFIWLLVIVIIGAIECNALIALRVRPRFRWIA